MILGRCDAFDVGRIDPDPRVAGLCASRSAIKQENARSAHEQDQNRSGCQAADMRPPRDILFGCSNGTEKLQPDPESQRPDSRYTDRYSPKCEHPDFDFGMQHKIGGDNAGHAAAGTDQWNIGIWLCPGMCKRRRDTAHDIEHDETDMTHRVFDIVAKDPEERHVADQMNPAPMQEHIGHKRESLGNRHSAVGDQHMSGDEKTAAEQLDGDDGKGLSKMAERKDQLGLKDDENKDVHHNERNSYILKRYAFQRVAIMERNEHFLRSLAVCAGRPQFVFGPLRVDVAAGHKKKIRETVGIAHSRV